MMFVHGHRVVFNTASPLLLKKRSTDVFKKGNHSLLYQRSRQQRIIPQAVLGNNTHFFVSHTASALQQIGAHITSAAVGSGHGVMTLARFIQSSIDPAVLGATANASFKLFLICAVVGWLLETNKIPNSTASVMSQVSFHLLIPCMLFSKVGSALASQPDLTLLFGFLAVTLCQVAIGTAWGLLLSPLVDGEYSRKFTIFGWHPKDPPKAVESIANSISAATGIPQLAPALLPAPPQAPAGFRELVAASCAFGNSFTLPAVFFLTLLPPGLIDTSLAYAALFLLGWSPAMWSVGMAIIDGATSRREKMQKQEQPVARRSTLALPSTELGFSSLGSSSTGYTSAGDQTIEATVVQPFFATSKASSISFDEDDHEHKDSTHEEDSNQSPLLFPSPKSIVDAIKYVIQAVKSAANTQHPVAASLRTFFSRTLNPPVWGILGGLALGITPIGRYLYALAAPDAVTSALAGGTSLLTPVTLPPELMLLQGAAKGMLEVIELMAAGTLAMQTLVLAASLLQKPEVVSSPNTTSGSATVPNNVGEALSGGKKGGKLRGVVGAVLRALTPVDAVEARALGILSLVRFLLMPVCTLLGLNWAIQWGWLGPLAADPIFLFVVAVESVMPSAQNLIILLQLSEGTRAAAPAFARMLLKLYAYAILPVTFWVTFFASRLSILSL